MIKLILVIFLALLLRLYNLGQSFWLDEAAQVIESARPLNEQLNIGADFHPPLYHLLLHFWMYLGNSEIWIRLLSVGLGLGVVFITYKTAKLLFSENVALVSSFLVAISPYLIWYSQEARPYILFVFLSLISTFFLLKKNWLAYIIVSILNLYTLYFAPFLFIGHFTYILFLKRQLLKNILLSFAVILVSFIPWLPFFRVQLVNGTHGIFQGWQNVVSIAPLKAIPLTFAKFIFGKGSIDNNIIYASIILPICIIFFINLIKILKKEEGKALAILFFIPFVTAVSIAFIIPIIAPQRLLFLLPFFIIIYVAGSYKRSKIYNIISILLLALLSTAGIVQYYTNPYVQREQWREAISYIESSGQKESSIALFVFPEPFAPYQWYMTDKVEALGIAPGFIVKQQDLENLYPKLQTKERIYFFQYLTGLTDPNGISIKYIKDLGYQETEVKDFPGVGLVYVYDKK